ncbi:DUF115 domain-containing protein [Heliobacterium undosum]|uniref:DUF115 domain-containing protein n=1 Tax=Heliomicrobium undosum TaxID=121734 RepID=A0A845L3N8_9FIRM|nr:6-hydroxymethylpterin diphosphokinase MptE-like protein [Heliomicrobium undosum]MZP29464.1 DUF115 domain-containing protein [Heliomicrobium undosum]
MNKVNQSGVTAEEQKLTWERNLKALKLYRAELYRQMEEEALRRQVSLEELAVYIGDGDGPLRPCQRKGHTYAEAVGGRPVFLHSRYDSVREAEDWAAGILQGHNREVQGNIDHLVVLGVGLGYHLIELLKHKETEGKIFAVDSRLDLFLASLTVVDWQTAFADKRLLLFFGWESKDFAEALAETVGFYQCDSVRIVDYSPVAKWNGDYYKQIIEEVLYVLNQVAAELATMMHFSGLWMENLFKNLPYVCGAKGINQFKDYFSGVPAIVVAAGPSLNKVLPVLKEAQRHALIISVGTAWKVLLKAGIEPDFVVAIDGGTAGWYHFEGTECEVPLIFDPKVYWGIPFVHRGPKIFAVTSDFLGQWLYRFGPYQEQQVQSGPSVSNVAFDIARRMGCDPIVFTGLDLCYADGYTHADGTVWRKKKEQDDRKRIPTINMYGEPVETTWAFQIFRTWFETEIPKSPHLHVYNASVGGLAIEGAENARLEEIPRLFDAGRDLTTLRQALREFLKTSPPFIDRDALTADMERVSHELTQVERLSRRGRDLSKRMHSLYARSQGGQTDRMNRTAGNILKELERIDAKIRESQEVNILLTLPFQSLYYEYFRRLDVPDDADEQVKGKKIAEAGQLLYDSIYRMTGETNKLVKESLDSLKKD